MDIVQELVGVAVFALMIGVPMLVAAYTDRR